MWKSNISRSLHVFSTYGGVDAGLFFFNGSPRLAFPEHGMVLPPVEAYDIYFRYAN